MKKSSSEYQDDVGKYPVRYRTAITKVFVDFIQSDEGKAVGTPKKLLQEFATYTDVPYRELTDIYYKKLENIRCSKSIKTIDDIYLFILIERFVWNYQPRKASDLLIRRDIHELANRLEEWHNFNNSMIISRHTNHPVFIKALNDSSVVYKIISTNKYGGMEDIYPSRYLAIKTVKDVPYWLAIIFCDPAPMNIFVGVYMFRTGTLFMRDTASRYPCVISLRVAGVDKIGIATNFSMLSGDYSGGNITGSNDPEEIIEMKDSRLENLAHKMFSVYEQLSDYFNEEKANKL